MADGPALKCPRCASAYVERMPVGARKDADDELSVDAEPSSQQPNTRCNACGHTWWVPAATSG